MIINGPSHYKLLRRPAGGQHEKFGFGSFLAFFSAKVLRGGPRALLQLTTCFVALVLVMKLLPHRLTDVNYSAWGWQKTNDGEEVQTSAVEYDGSVPGGLRIVVFGESDVATPARLQGRGTEDTEGRSWTEVLCEELNCSSYLSFVPTSGDRSRVMTSTKLYAKSVEQALNLTVESYDPDRNSPGLDYNFQQDEFPVEWQAADLSRQVDAFLAMEKPRHSPAETLWVFSFGMWDIWSLASEPLGVSKPIVDSVVEHIFVEVERLYASAMNETLIAWSGPSNQTSETTTSSVVTGLPTPTPDPATDRQWIKERNPVEEGASALRAEDETRHFRVLIPKLFDPSLTPGWHSGRPDIPAVHSKAEQMRNAAVLTEKWNSNLYRSMADWVRTGERILKGSEVLEAAKGRGLSGKTPLEIFNQVLQASKESGQRANTAVVGGHNHIAPTSPTRGSDAKEEEKQKEDGKKQEGGGKKHEEDEKKQEGQEAAAGNNSAVDTTPGPRLPQRDGILYDLSKYLEEVIVERQLKISGLRDARRAGKLTEQGFLEVWMPCVAEPSDESKRDEAEETASPEEADGAVEGGGAAYERKRSLEPAIRGREPPSAEPSAGPTPRAESAEARMCADPDDRLFYTPFTVSPRAVAVIARQAADMVRRNETMRSGWTSINRPPLTYVGG